MDIEKIENLNIKPHQKIKLIFNGKYNPSIYTGYVSKYNNKNIEILTENNYRLCSSIDIIKKIELI